MRMIDVAMIEVAWGEEPPVGEAREARQNYYVLVWDIERNSNT